MNCLFRKDVLGGGGTNGLSSHDMFVSSDEILSRCSSGTNGLFCHDIFVSSDFVTKLF
jgi:hypothetical protein